MNVLVVEDDEIILEGLIVSLRQEGYDVVSATTQEQAFSIIHSGTMIDICLLDVMLPDGDGFAICKEIRKKSNVPVIFITACDDEVHTVLAFEQGADDYIAKPFRIREMLARIKAVLRRSGMQSDADVVYVGENQVHIKQAKVFRNNAEIVLTAMEYKLLLIFINNRGQVLSRRQILNAVWDDAGDFVNDNTLTVYIKRLREKLGEADDAPLICTVRGVGYRME